MPQSKGYTQKVIQYVTNHPGCYFTHVVLDAKIPKGIASTTLWILTRDGILRREGFEKRYRYYAVDPSDIPVNSSKKRSSLELQKKPNPLTNLFNQRLAEVRGGRRA